MTPRPLTTVTADEISLLTAAVASIGLDETEDEALHLYVGDEGRQWIVEAEYGQLVIDVADDAGTPHPDGWLALSDRIRRFADCFSELVAEGGLTLSVVDDATVVASVGPVTAAVDCVPQTGPLPDSWCFSSSASARVPMREFVLMLMAVRSMPAGLDGPHYPMPPMWLQLANGEVGLHVDWTDFLPSRGTYRIAAGAHDGEATVAIPHAVIEAFLRRTPLLDDAGDDVELTISVGTVRHEGVPRDAIALSSGLWRLVLWTVHPLVERWADHIRMALLAEGLPIIDEDGVEWIIDTGERNVRITLHHGHPDIARVSALLIDGAGESLELLRELSQLNSAATGVRFWFEHGTVRAAADLRCTDIGALPDVAREVGTAAANYAPMISALAGM